LLIAGLTSVLSAASRPERVVLVIHELTPNYPWFTNTYAGFQSIINEQSDSPVYLYVENLGISQFGSARYYEHLRNHFQEKYREKSIGMIVSFGPLALPYALRLRDDLWPSAPLAFSWVDEKIAARLTLPGNVTGITYQRTPQDVFAIARTLLPGLKRIALVGDPIGQDNFSKAFMDELSATDLGVIDLTPLSMAELKQRVASLPEDAAIAYPGISVDGAGARFVPRQALQEIAEVANRPIIVDAETFIGAGAIGGLVISPDAMGRNAARLALRILNGENAANIPVTMGDSPRPVFDWRQMQRWGVSESRLPPDSEIRSRPPTVWEQYRWQVTAIAAVFLLQVMMICWLLLERRRRSFAEIEARNRRREAIHLNRVATATVMSSSLAHELGQPLGSILLNVETAREMLKSVPPDLKQVDEVLSDVIRDEQRASEIVSSQKDFLKRERGTELQVFDLNDSVREVIVIAASEAAKRGVALRAGRSPEALPVRADRIQMQQVMLNLVMNGMDALERCDPAARTVIIQASRNAASRAIEVTVSDSGEGIPEDKLTSIFDPFFTTKPQGTGLGLPIARTIIETHGGAMWAENRAGGGAAFHFTLPLADAMPASAHQRA
jgi:signal transduction histidine kinase